MCRRSASVAASSDAQAFVTYSELQHRERENLVAALEAANWKVSGAAELLGLKASTLTSKMKALGIGKPA